MSDERSHDGPDPYGTLGGGPSIPADPAGPAAATTGPPESTPEPPVDLSRYLLPAEVWESSAPLRHIYRAAMARVVCPDALLHAVLAIVASLLHHDSRVDTGKRPSVLSYYFAAIGESGGGKSEALDTARELMSEWVADRFAITGNVADGQPGYIDAPTGSGEGLCEAFMGPRLDPVLDDDGKPVLDKKTGYPKVTTTRAQVRHNALFFADEGRQMLAIDSRQGATVTAVLCEMWSGSIVGQTNADSGRTRKLAAGSYVVGLLLGFQVATIDALFADEAGGAPQRFAYAPAPYRPHWDDPDADDAPWPGDLFPDVPVAPVTVRLATEQRGEVRRYARRKAAGLSGDGPLDGHRMLLRCRIAALLALLHGADVVSPEVWELAETLTVRSCGLRDWLADGVQRRAAAIARARDNRAVQVATRVETVSARRDRIRCAADQIVDAVDGQELTEGRALNAARRFRDVAADGLALALSDGRLVRERRPGAAGGGPREVTWIRPAS